MRLTVPGWEQSATRTEQKLDLEFRNDGGNAGWCRTSDGPSAMSIRLHPVEPQSLTERVSGVQDVVWAELNRGMDRREVRMRQPRGNAPKEEKISTLWQRIIPFSCPIPHFSGPRKLLRNSGARPKLCPQSLGAYIMCPCQTRPVETTSANWPSPPARASWPNSSDFSDRTASGGCCPCWR